MNGSGIVVILKSLFMRGRVVWDVGRWNFQLHWPMIRTVNRELFIRVPLVFRVSFRTPDGAAKPNEYVSGIGLVIGVGASVLYTHNKEVGGE